MAELTIYQQPNFPAIYKWRVIAFMQMEWASIFYDDKLIHLGEVISWEK